MEITINRLQNSGLIFGWGEFLFCNIGVRGFGFGRIIFWDTLANFHLGILISVGLVRILEFRCNTVSVLHL